MTGNKLKKEVPTHHVTVGVGFPATLTSRRALSPVMAMVSTMRRMKVGASESSGTWRRQVIFIYPVYLILVTISSLC